MRSNIKLCGCIGALFPFVVFIPYGDFILAPICACLLGYAVRSYLIKANRLDTLTLFRNGLLISIVGFLIGFAVISVGSVVYIAGYSEACVIIIIIGALVGYVSAVKGSALVKDALAETATLTKNSLFKWAGLLIFWGAVLSIALVGVLVSLAGSITLSAAFLTMPDEKGSTAKVACKP